VGPHYPPWQRILDEISIAGFEGSELGPLGYLPCGTTLRDALTARGLSMPAGFVMEPLAGGEKPAALAEVAKRTCEVLADAGASTLILIDGLDGDRARTAGRSEQARRLGASAWGVLLQSVQTVSRLATEHGLRTAFHPHAGTHVEFADEIERLMENTSPAELGLCLDTGHATYAGIDPAALARTYSQRLAYVHLKDVDLAVLRRAREQGLSFADAVSANVFVPLGEGSVALAEIARWLTGTGYEGWLTIEQDRVLDAVDDALDDARASLRHARRVGF
jgi:inosose dehydratase